MDTTPDRPPRSRLQSAFFRRLHARSESDEKKAASKDGWDKFSTVSGFLGTVVVALAGFAVTQIFTERASVRDARIRELDVVVKLLPYLASDESEQIQQLAWASVDTLGSTQLVARLAELSPTPAAIRTIENIATSTARSEEDRTTAAEALKNIKEIDIGMATRGVWTAPVSRPITSIHIHHTGQPTAEGYRNDSVHLLYQFQTEQMGWSNIGSHFLLSPTGRVWTGRPLNDVPASIAGKNIGAVSVSLILNGNEETPSDAQSRTFGLLLLALMDRFNLDENALILHNEYSPQLNCPGRHVSRQYVLGAIGTVRAAMDKFYPGSELQGDGLENASDQTAEVETSIDELTINLPSDPDAPEETLFEIDEAGRKELEVFVRALPPSAQLVVIGHTDEIGTHEKNMARGEQSAGFVKSLLIDLGVKEEMIRTVSYGEEMPIDNGHNEEAWDANRRVEVSVVKG